MRTREEFKAIHREAMKTDREKTHAESKEFHNIATFVDKNNEVRFAIEFYFRNPEEKAMVTGLLVSALSSDAKAEMMAMTNDAYYRMASLDHEVTTPLAEDPEAVEALMHMFITKKGDDIEMNFSSDPYSYSPHGLTWLEPVDLPEGAEVEFGGGLLESMRQMAKIKPPPLHLLLIGLSEQDNFHVFLDDDVLQEIAGMA